MAGAQFLKGDFIWRMCANDMDRRGLSWWYETRQYLYAIRLYKDHPAGPDVWVYCINGRDVPAQKQHEAIIAFFNLEVA
jgi:hypothetical protein